MKNKDIVSDSLIEVAIKRSGFTGRTNDECRLCLLELLVKAMAGCRNGHTEESFLAYFQLMKKDRTPNWLGRKFIMSMVYASSNNRPISFGLMKEYRK
jgi:hypothetical protein